VGFVKVQKNSVAPIGNEVYVEDRMKPVINGSEKPE